MSLSLSTVHTCVIATHWRNQCKLTGLQYKQLWSLIAWPWNQPWGEYSHMSDSCQMDHKIYLRSNGLLKHTWPDGQLLCFVSFHAASVCPFAVSPERLQDHQAILQVKEHNIMDFQLFCDRLSFCSGCGRRPYFRGASGSSGDSRECCPSSPPAKKIAQWWHDCVSLRQINMGLVCFQMFQSTSTSSGPPKDSATKNLFNLSSC